MKPQIFATNALKPGENVRKPKKEEEAGDGLSGQMGKLMELMLSMKSQQEEQGRQIQKLQAEIEPEMETIEGGVDMETEREIDNREETSNVGA